MCPILDLRAWNRTVWRQRERMEVEMFTPWCQWNHPGRARRGAGAGGGLLTGQRDGWQGQVLQGLQRDKSLAPEGHCDLQGDIWD